MRWSPRDQRHLTSGRDAEARVTARSGDPARRQWTCLAGYPEGPGTPLHGRTSARGTSGRVRTGAPRSGSVDGPRTPARPDAVRMPPAGPAATTPRGALAGDHVTPLRAADSAESCAIVRPPAWGYSSAGRASEWH